MESSKKNLLTPLAGAIATAITPTQQALAQSDASEYLLEEIIVTATKRAVSVQDISATVQALTAESLAAMGARGMEDYSRFIPSMSVLTFGAGSSTIVFRGAITGQGFIAQSTSSVYLDEISVTTTGSQPDIRMVDIERVEALSGPQGTLYGSDAQAGTLRIITNKPVMNEFEAVVDLELRGGSKSDASYRASVVFNFPVVEDKLALRLVGFSDRDGGYIDNVFGHTPDSPAIPFTAPTGQTSYPAGFGTLDNSNAVEKNWNDADIYGARAILAWEINENWRATFTALTQNTKSGAGNDFDPFVGELQTVRFHNEYRDDEYQMYSMVIEGDLGFAQLVGAVNYFDREVEQVNDITAYAHYWAQRYCQDYNAYYTAAYLPYYWKNPDSNYIVWWPVYCMGEKVDSDFFSSYYEPLQQTKFTTEIRLSHQGDRVDWIAGFYYEDANDTWQAPFATPTTGGNGDQNLYQNSISLDFWEWYFSNYYGSAATYPQATSHWYSDNNTEFEQTAVFGEFTWHINDAWDLTLGGRYFERTNNNIFFVDHPGDIGLNGEPDVTDPNSRAFILEFGHPPNHSQEDKEFIPKVSLSWSFADDKRIYALYTQGARPGGINRARGQPFFPVNYLPDMMDNYEMGYRSSFGNGRGRLNATFYHMAWDGYQLELTDPSQTACPNPSDSIAHVCGQPWQEIVANAGDAHITGLFVELDYAISDNWVFGGNIEFNEAETDTNIDLDDDGEDDITDGMRLPVSPELKGSFWLDYGSEVDWFGGTQFFSRLQGSYTGDSLSVLEPRGLDTPNPQFKTPSYSIFDIRVGIRGQTWEVSMFLNNFTDERAIYTIANGYMEWGMAANQDGRAHLQRAYTNRPRELGIRYTKSWGG
jgi:outer membrane receptor protein involved in Fe transport